MKKICTLIAVVMLALTTESALSAPGVGIIATVGEDAITNQDLVARTKLMIISSGLPADDETARKVSPQVLQGLINERLQLQEAAKLGLNIDPADIQKAISGIEEQNKMPPGQLKIITQKANIPYSSLEQQVAAQIAWAKVRARKIQPKVSVSDDEVTDFLKSQTLNPTQEEYMVNEIVLPVETPKDEQKMKELAEKLTKELVSGKANFKNLAKQFSQSASAQNGGEVGWMTESQLPKDFLAEIKKSGTGKVLGPIRSIEGYFILFVPESRLINNNADLNIVTLRQFEFPVKGLKSSPDQAAKSLNDASKACMDSDNYARSKGAVLQDYGSIQIKELVPAIRRIVSGLNTGEFSKPVNTGSTIAVFIVCEKSENMDALANESLRARAYEVISKRKMDLESRKYLRDMRRNTNIEIKI